MPNDDTARPLVSVIVPTYQEVDSLPDLLDRLGEVRRDDIPDLEVIIVDDDSRDGTEEMIDSRNESWVRLITRREGRGLSSAVLRGFQESTGHTLVVMDADGSHPPESIPDFLTALGIGAEMVIGSRYVRGGSTEDGWGFLRWINSKAATVMARPFTSVRDPMSGFMALRRETWDRCRDLDPIGYKIGLEIIVKSGIGNVTEVPIHFSTRSRGCSKLNASVQWQYLVHIVRLCRYKYPEWSTFIPFAMVGASGMAVYLLLLWALEAWLSSTVSIGIITATAILLTVVWNFTWDRLIAFWYAAPGHVTRQLVSFAAVCLVGIAINWWITTSMAATQSLAVAGLVGSLVGSGAGLLFNYLCSRFLIFRRHRPEDRRPRREC